MTPFAIPGLMGSQPVNHLPRVTVDAGGRVQHVLHSQAEELPDPELRVAGLTLENRMWLDSAVTPEVIVTTTEEYTVTWTLVLDAAEDPIPDGLSILRVWNNLTGECQELYLDYNGTTFGPVS